MSSDLEFIKLLTDQLVNGWSERVERDVVFTTHSEICLMLRGSNTRDSCPCPSVIEKHIEPVRQKPLLEQLQDAIREPLTGADNGGRSVTKVDPDLPGNFDAHDLIQEVKRDLSAAVRRARQILGYDQVHKLIEGIVCGECGGGLRIDADSVRCVGKPDEPPCGVRYAAWAIEQIRREARNVKAK